MRDALTHGPKPPMLPLPPGLDMLIPDPALPGDGWPRYELKRRATMRFDTASEIVDDPTAVAFDGQNIWVANTADGTVTELRASDGAFQQNVHVGAQPRALAFDGASLWVANSGDGTVTKLDATNGAILGVFPVQSTPFSLAFDGTSMWVGGLGSILKLASDGTIQATTPFIGLTQSLVFDGASMWAVQSGGTQVSQLRLSDGAFLRAFNSGNNTYALAFDGANIWVTNHDEHSVSKL